MGSRKFFILTASGQYEPETRFWLLFQISKKQLLIVNFETNDSDNNFILLQRRFDASCIIFKLRIKYSRFILIITVRVIPRDFKYNGPHFDCYLVT